MPQSTTNGYQPTTNPHTKKAVKFCKITDSFDKETNVKKTITEYSEGQKVVEEFRDNLTVTKTYDSNNNIIREVRAKGNNTTVIYNFFHTKGQYDEQIIYYDDGTIKKYLIKSQTKEIVCGFHYNNYEDLLNENNNFMEIRTFFHINETDPTMNNLTENQVIGNENDPSACDNYLGY